MQVLKTIQPKSPGAQRFLREWGDKLVAVRYRDAGANTTLTTIEIVVDQRTRSPGASTNRPLRHYREQIVALQVDYEETKLRENLKQRGARWSRQLKLWLLKRDAVIGIGLQDRIVEGAAEQCLDVDTSLL